MARDVSVGVFVWFWVRWSARGQCTAGWGIGGGFCAGRWGSGVGVWTAYGSEEMCGCIVKGEITLGSGAFYRAGTHAKS